jgi:hypothetical protein
MQHVGAEQLFVGIFAAKEMSAVDAAAVADVLASAATPPIPAPSGAIF